jgi:molecular chaperone IbpA
VVAGKAKEAADDSTFLHRGIARRAFERRFALAEHIKVTGAHMENGLLHVELVREVPEAKKPRTIEIQRGAPAQPKVIETQAA